MQESKVLAPIDEMKKSLVLMEPEFKKALPAHIPVEKFVRVIQTALSTTPALLTADRNSFWAACCRAAESSLMPDGKQAAFVMFGNKCQFMPMVAGILRTIRNSGEIASISPNVVYTNDEFDYFVDENGDHLNHKPCLDGPRGDFKLVYCLTRTKDKAVYITVMTKEEIDKVRKSSKSGDSGPWKTWYEEMAKKTVIRRQAKILPSSTDIEQLLASEDEIADYAESRIEPAAAPAKTTSSRLSGLVGGEDEGTSEPAIETTATQVPEDRIPI